MARVWVRNEQGLRARVKIRSSTRLMACAGSELWLGLGLEAYNFPGKISKEIEHCKSRLKARASTCFRGSFGLLQLLFVVARLFVEWSVQMGIPFDIVLAMGPQPSAMSTGSVEWGRRMEVMFVKASPMMLSNGGGIARGIVIYARFKWERNT